MSEIRDISELDPKLRKLVRQARRVRRHAYAPYSRYPVGAAILDKKGKTHTGCNVENSSYVGICAERVAIGKMISRGSRSIAFVAVVTSEDVPVFPCGNCLQALSEFGLDCVVIAANGRGTVFRRLTFRELFPYSFIREELKKAIRSE